MIRGAWMYPREDEAVLKICWEPRHSDKPCADSERAQRWRMSLASLLFFTVLLSNHLWLVSAGAKARGNFSYSHQPARGEQANSSLLSLQSFPGEGKGCWDNFLSNSTKFAAHTPHCTGARSSHLDSACTKLHSQRHRGSVGPSSSQPSSSRSHSPSSTSYNQKRNFLKAYFNNFTLSFCDTYTILDLLLGMSNPDSLNCSLENLMEDFVGTAAASSSLSDDEVCSNCIQAYQRLDQHAQEKYEEFDFVLEKYLQSGEYSVRSCVGDCKAVYKAWLCSEYFNVTQRQCRNGIPCKQYCLEVQTRCPFILPDNDDLIYGGLPGFICAADLLENHMSNTDAVCCDVRWHSCNTGGSGAHNTSTKSLNSQSMYYQHRNLHHQHSHHRHHHLHTYHHHHKTSLLPVSAGSRLGNTRLKLCVLVLMLLHTMASFSAVQNGVSLEAMPGMDETSAREE
ncbi:NALCN channel auxiliary factor 2 [Hyperolius riggenbachi]|uniref:NALCN channel auxiliary factor 2 n=1 Tax=Hyperolius riggenbachi TaxID=752182 RepID=UPI0035A3AB40